MKTKKCYACKKDIDLDTEKYVVLGTYKGKKQMDENHFHFQCWIDYFNKKIMQRIQKGQEMAMGMVQNVLKGMNVKIQNG